MLREVEWSTNEARVSLKISILPCICGALHCKCTASRCISCLHITQNATLLTEKQLLKEQIRQLDSQNTQLNAQLLGLQRQSASQQEHSTALHTQMAQLQVGLLAAPPTLTPILHFLFHQLNLGGGNIVLISSCLSEYTFN